MATKVTNSSLTASEISFLESLGDIMESVLHSADKSNSSNHLTKTDSKDNDPEEVSDSSQDHSLSEDKLILGKDGRRILYNDKLIQELLTNGLTIKDLSTKYNVNYYSLAMYIKNHNFTYHRRSRKSNTTTKEDAVMPIVPDKPKTNNFSFSTPNKPITKPSNTGRYSCIPDDWRTDPAYKLYVECSICGKVFLPSSQHMYKDKKNNKVCSYSCARKAGTL